MLTVKTPFAYENEPGALERSDVWAEWAGRHAAVIGGETALKTALPLLADRLADAGTTFKLFAFSGYCTAGKIDKLTAQAGADRAGLIVGVGGGSALDTAKAVGERLNLPVVAVPTVPATCAAWSALTVLYDDEGRASGYLPLKRSPARVVADTRLLAASPRRYLASGIADTVVKWYETGLNERPGEPRRLDVQIGLQTAALALAVLEEHSRAVYAAAAGDGQVTSAYQEVTDAILSLAGVVGSFGGGRRRAALAHAVHDALTQFPETRDTLHGEKVAFGLLVQLALAGREDEAERWSRFYRELGLPVTLRELGFRETTAGLPEAIAIHLRLPDEAAAALPFPYSEALLARAVATADALGQSAPLQA